MSRAHSVGSADVARGEGGLPVMVLTSHRLMLRLSVAMGRSAVINASLGEIFYGGMGEGHNDS